MDTKPYFQKIEEGLCWEPEKRARIIKDLRESVYLYLEESPAASMEDLYELFGTPEQIIEDNTETVPISALKKAKRRKYWVIGALAAIALVFAGMMAYSFIDGYKSNRGHLEVYGPYVITSQPLQPQTSEGDASGD